MAARSGKIIRSNNTIVNEADGINDDGSRNVKLTGSIVEQGRVNNFLVTAGSRTLFVNLNVKDYTRYTVESRSTIAHTYSIDVDFSVPSGAVFGYRATKTFSSSAAGIILSTPDYLQTPILNCYIRNNDTVDHYYDAGVILFK
jgi:hypothetical protein